MATNNLQNRQGLEFERWRLPLAPMQMPPPGEVHLWFMNLNALGSPMSAAHDSGASPPLNPKQERSVRRFYLRLLLASYLGLPGKEVRISRLIRGKPVLDPAHHLQKLDFSSAGSSGCCLIGVSSTGALGVDLELSDRRTLKPMALARRYFSRDEQQALQGLPGTDIDRAFLHTWACKEAVVKAAGLGIANQLCRFTVDTNPENPPALLRMDGDEASSWRLAIVRPANGFVGSVALKHPQLRLRGFLLERDTSRA